MFLLGFRRKLAALALCKSIESAIQLFQIHNRIAFATIQNPAVYLSSERVSIFSTLVPRLSVSYFLWVGGTSANSAKPDQTPQNATSYQFLHCLLAECSIKIWF